MSLKPYATTLLIRFLLQKTMKTITIDLNTVWKEKYRAINWTLWLYYYHKSVHWSIYTDYKHIIESPYAK